MEHKGYPNMTPIVAGDGRDQDNAKDQLDSRDPKMVDMTAFQAFLLGTLGLYLVACVSCVLAAGPGPGHEANWGPLFGMFMFAQFALPGGLLAMLITLPLGRLVGLTSQTVAWMNGIAFLGILLCWIYALFIWG